MRNNERGNIDKVIPDDNSNIHNYNADGHQFIKVRVSILRQPEIGDKFACYTPDHEVLTTNGWIPINQVNMTHYVASLNPQTHEVEYRSPTKLYDYDFDGNLYHIKNQQIDLTVTQNHNMYIKESNSTEYQLIEAHHIQGKSVKYLKNAKNNNLDYQFLLPETDRFNDRVIDMDSWLEFFGWWIAEGWVSKNKRQNRD